MYLPELHRGCQGLTRGEYTRGVTEILRVFVLNHHIPKNQASGRVMEKAGMQYEGLLRQRMFAKGRYWDIKQYASTKEEWLESGEYIDTI